MIISLGRAHPPAMETFMRLSDEQWEKVRSILPPSPREGRPRSDDRRTVNAILFVLKGHIPWNYLPREFGDDATANRRFKRWEREGVWRRIEEALSLSGYLPVDSDSSNSIDGRSDWDTLPPRD